MAAEEREKARATLTGQEYRLLFKGGRRLLTKMETALKNKFTNVVAKFFEMFRSPACKYHEIKKQEALHYDCLL